MFYLSTQYQFFQIFLCLKFYFPSPLCPVDRFQVANSLLSHSSCYFLHPRFSRCSSYSSFRWIPFPFFLGIFILPTWPHQFNCLYLLYCKTEFLIFIFSLILSISRYKSINVRGNGGTNTKYLKIIKSGEMKLLRSV